MIFLSKYLAIRIKKIVKKIHKNDREFNLRIVIVTGVAQARSVTSAKFIDFDLAERNHGYWQRKRNNLRISSPTRSVTIARRSLQIDFNELEERHLGGPRPRWSCIAEDERGSLATTTVMDSVVEKWWFNRCFAHFSSSLMTGCPT